MPLNVPYKPKSNYVKSISFRKKDEGDLLALNEILKVAGVAPGEYLIDAYRELDKGNPDWNRLKQIRYARWLLL